MFNKVLTLLTLATLLLVNSFNYSYSYNSIDTIEIYDNLISKAQIKMNNSIKDIEKEYNKSIKNIEDSLVSIKDIIKQQEEIIARQANIATAQAGSSGLQMSEADLRDIKSDTISKYGNNLVYYKSQIIKLEKQVNDIKNDKEKSINNIREQYQNQINQYKTDKEKLLNNNEYISKETINTNPLNFNNKSCGINSFLTSNGECSCNTGYIWENYDAVNNLNCKKEFVKTPEQLCKEKYGNNSISDLTQNKNGSYNCICKNGYIWNLNTTACIKDELKINLPEKIKIKIDKVFESIKTKSSNLLIGKREEYYKNMKEKVEYLIKNQKSETNKNILTYLKYLIDKELEIINNTEPDLDKLFDELDNKNNFKCGDNISFGEYIYTTKLMPDGKCWTTTNMKHLSKEGKSWCYDNNSNNCESYGRLYDWNSANKVCSQLGDLWYLPSTDQWTNLINNGATGWGGNKLLGIIYNLPGYYSVNSFSNFGKGGARWSSSEYNKKGAYAIFLYSFSNSSTYGPNEPNAGFNVVCTKK